MYITDLDLKTMRSVKDEKLDELFQEARLYDKTLLISEISWKYRKWFWGKEYIQTEYFTYHEVLDSNGKSMYQARQMFCASGDKKIVMAYLYGIINGHLKNESSIS